MNRLTNEIDSNNKSACVNAVVVVQLSNEKEKKNDFRVFLERIKWPEMSELRLVRQRSTVQPSSSVPATARGPPVFPCSTAFPQTHSAGAAVSLNLSPSLGPSRIPVGFLNSARLLCFFSTAPGKTKSTSIH